MMDDDDDDIDESIVVIVISVSILPSVSALHGCMDSRLF